MTAAPAQAASSSTPSMRIAPRAVSAWIVVTSAALVREVLHAIRTMRTETGIDPLGTIHPWVLTGDPLHNRELREKRSGGEAASGGRNASGSQRRCIWPDD